MGRQITAEASFDDESRSIGEIGVNTIEIFSRKKYLRGWRRRIVKSRYNWSKLTKETTLSIGTRLSSVAR